MLNITEVGEVTGLASSALRFYERHGLIEPSGRAGGKRVYDDDVIERLALIDIYQQAGFTVSEIGVLLAADSPETWRTMAKAKLGELEEKIAVASQAKLLLEHTLQCPNPVLGGCGKFSQAVGIHAEHLRHRASASEPGAHGVRGRSPRVTAHSRRRRPVRAAT